RRRRPTARGRTAVSRGRRSVARLAASAPRAGRTARAEPQEARSQRGDLAGEGRRGASIGRAVRRAGRAAARDRGAAARGRSGGSGAAFRGRAAGRRTVAARDRQASGGVPRDDANYRGAAVRAVQLASGLNALGFELEHFVGRFVAKGPQDDAEVEAFYQLARLYLRHDFAENAKEALQKIEARYPDYRDVAELLASLTAQSRATPMVAAAVLGDAAHHHRKSLPRLPDLDDLPGVESPGTLAPATLMRRATLEPAELADGGSASAQESFAP